MKFVVPIIFGVILSNIYLVAVMSSKWRIYKVIYIFIFNVCLYKVFLTIFNNVLISFILDVELQ
jgi:hypothetical protein